MEKKTKRIPAKFRESKEGSERVRFPFDILPVIHNFPEQGKVVVEIGNCKVTVTTRFPSIQKWIGKDIVVKVENTGDEDMEAILGKDEIKVGEKK